MLLHADDLLDQQRVWTSEDQRSIEAKLLDADADKRTAKLRRKDGYTFTIEWNMLSAADQAALQKWTDARRQPVSTPTTSSKPPEELPKKFVLKKVPMIKQSYNYCVPASASMIAGFHDIETDQNELAKLSSFSSEGNQGTYPRDMLLAMEKLGFTGKSMHWQNEAVFMEDVLPKIKRALYDVGPIYISFKAGVFGEMGHGCVIVGFNDRAEELHFYNPWGNEFERDYELIAKQCSGIVIINPPDEAPSADEAFIKHIQSTLPKITGSILDIVNRLTQTNQDYELIWCNRYDERNSKRYAEHTAKNDGRKILELAFERNPAVIIPYSPDGQTEHCYLVIRPPEGGSRFYAYKLTTQGWEEPELYTLGSLTREWPTLLKLPNQSDPIWELPLIELQPSDSKRSDQ